MRRMFVDTSAWFAYVNRSDPDHAAVAPVLRAHEGRLVTSSYVFDELVTLLRYRADHATAVRVGAWILDAATVDLVQVTAEDERRAWALFTGRPDQSYSFTDCTSFALMRRLGIDEAVALDDDFVREGFRTHPG
ncbi:MAG: PIN domain-containing protein [Planctomycetes bacterium]|nr:PIN domain-containing protein [Planctomycetota bacterium]